MVRQLDEACSTVPITLALVFFFFNDTATPEIYTLSLHDALPIYMDVSTKWVAIAATSSVVLSACYTLWMYKRVVMGDLVKDSVKSMKDMTAREFGYFVPLMLLTLWMGFYPMPFLDILHVSVEHLITQATTSKLDAAAALVQAMPVLDAAHH